MCYNIVQIQCLLSQHLTWTKRYSRGWLWRTIFKFVGSWSKNLLRALERRDERGPRTQNRKRMSSGPSKAHHKTHMNSGPAQAQAAPDTVTAATPWSIASFASTLITKPIDYSLFIWSLLWSSYVSKWNVKNMWTQKGWLVPCIVHPFCRNVPRCRLLGITRVEMETTGSQSGTGSPAIMGKTIHRGLKLLVYRQCNAYTAWNQWIFLGHHFTTHQ